MDLVILFTVIITIELGCLAYCTIKTNKLKPVYVYSKYREIRKIKHK